MSLITLILVLAAAAVLIVLGTTRRKDGGDGKKTLPRTIVTAAAVLVLVGALGFGSVYQLQEDEYAVITTFGKPSVVSTSGLKFKIPIIQQKTIVSKATQGFALGYDLRTNVNNEDESLMISVDFNFVNVDFYVEYRVDDPVKYLYNSEEPEAILKMLCQSYIRDTIGLYGVDDIITTGSTVSACALALLQGRGNDIYTTTQGERVMAETVLVPYAAGNIAAMRLVTSLRLADEQWWNTVTLAVGLGLLIFLFSVWSGLFFVRSIVRPLGEVETTANRIAHGDLRARLPDTRYDDEIGRLCKTINQMAGDLAETDRLKNEFISSVSHELRTPLTSIKGWVETIENIDDPNSEYCRRGLAVIGTETDRLYTMVEELLDFSRLQNGIKLNCEVLDFVAEATDAALFVEARIRQEGLHLVYDEPPEPYPVWADPARLRQVFVNVFDNAIKYSPPEGTIFFTLTRTATTVTASIRDQGRGIAPDDLQNVKMKFFKAKNAVRGSGIGLAVVDEITKALGGTADITSTLGQGTTVTITLPIYHAGQEHLHEPI